MLYINSVSYGYRIKSGGKEHTEYTLKNELSVNNKVTKHNNNSPAFLNCLLQRTFSLNQNGLSLSNTCGYPKQIYLYLP